MKGKRYCVYMHINRVNNKKYIGITSRTPEVRWNNGYGYKGQSVFYNAIKKYGWDMFDHKILFTNLSEEEAKNKEIEMIDKYKTNVYKHGHRYGYNMTDGGDSGKSKPSDYIGKNIKGFIVLDVCNRRTKLQCTKCGKVIDRCQSTLSVKNSNIKCECMKQSKPKPRVYHWVTYNGETKTLQQWSKELGIRRNVLYSRIKRGWDIDDVFNKPIQQRKQPIKCMMCGNEFIPNKKISKYCGVKCQHEALKKPKEICICLHCGKEFERGRDTKGLYCSKECARYSPKYLEAQRINLAKGRKKKSK